LELIMGGDSSSNSGGSASAKRCGVGELVIFLTAIAAGTACSICSKTMMSMHGTGITGETEAFSKPIFQTFGMFVGMMFGLVMHWIVLYFQIPFPGYEHELMRQQQQQQQQQLPRYSGGNAAASEQDALLKPTGASTSTTTTKVATTPVWMYFFLAVPSIFDLAATALCMMGLRYLDVSIYQLLRGSGIIFVALMKQHVLGDRLYVFQWIGVLWNVVSVVLVGATAVLNSQGEHTDVLPAEALLGVALVMAGAFVQALQFVFEEKVMTMDEASAPPLLLIGMEGLWGTVLCLLVVYPVVYYIPGSDHGSYEDPFNTWAMFVQSPNIQVAFCVYFFAIFAYNLFAVLVTFMLNSVWRTYTFWWCCAKARGRCLLDRSHVACILALRTTNRRHPGQLPPHHGLVHRYVHLLRPYRGRRLWRAVDAVELRAAARHGGAAVRDGRVQRPQRGERPAAGPVVRARVRSPIRVRRDRARAPAGRPGPGVGGAQEQLLAAQAQLHSWGPHVPVDPHAPSHTALPAQGRIDPAAERNLVDRESP
jgi:drug/metabolite transporter (DMT)-like permease